jgi:DNA-binding MarR family transcriptional regulator
MPKKIMARMNKKAAKSGTVAAPETANPQGGIHGLVGYQLALATVVLAGVYFRQVGQPLQMGRLEFTILNLVGESDGMTPTQVSKTIAIKTSNITVAVDKLVNRGLLIRQKSNHDGRAQHLHLTAEGQELIKDAVVSLHQEEERTLGHLSAAERLMLVELLGKAAKGPRK